MKTNEEILERFLSPLSADFFNAQRTVLINLLPFDMAKPYLDENYVSEHEAGTLPEDERWEESNDPKTLLMEHLAEMHKLIRSGDEMRLSSGLQWLKGLLWVVDADFYDRIHVLFGKDEVSMVDSSLKEISDHFGYKPIIEDVEFEEIPND